MFGKLKLGKQSPPLQPKTFSLGPTETSDDDWDLPDVKPDKVHKPDNSSTAASSKHQPTPQKSATVESKSLPKPSPSPRPTSTPMPSSTLPQPSPSRDTSTTEVIQPTKGSPVDTLKVNSSPPSPIISVRFYGQEVRKRHQGGWWFLLDDLLALASPSKPDKPVSKRKDFNEKKQPLARTIDGVEYVDAEGALELMREIDGVFPGPLARWLQESAAMPAPDSN